MKRLLPVGLLLLFAGCSTGAIDQNVLSNAQNKTLSLIIHETPDFLAVTPDKNLLTSVGFNAAISDGNIFIHEHEVYDPARKISKMLAQTINSEFGLLYNENIVKKSRMKDIKSLERLANGRDFVLSVETDAWLFTYNIKQEKYHVRYIVKARLIDANRGKVVWQDACDYDTLSTGEPLVNYETLIEKDAAYLKKTLEKAATFCVDTFSKELL